MHLIEYAFQINQRERG